MKRLFICLNAFALSLCACVAYGKAVDENTAKTIGSNYLNSIGINTVQGASGLTTAYVAKAVVGGVSVNDFYAFNFVGDKGFVIVSADDQVIPILAYSTESSFDVSHMAPDAKWWMNGYANQITYVIEHSLPAKTGTAEQWSNLKAAGAVNNKKAAERTTTPFPSSSAHLLTTTWDQEPGYNEYCPTGTPTGCVATCMAEIMQFWNWPTVGCGYHSYTPSTTPSFGLKTADFGNTVYDWATMDAHLTSSSAATATLMQHTGYSVNMDYTTSAAGSGAYVIQMESPVINCAEYALKTYFHYKPTLKGYPRSGESYLSLPAIPDATWVNMIETELNAGRPVMYSGSGSDGGHCWVCDGWNTSGTGTGGAVFHFNFGWSGSSNGFYSIDNVAPPALGTGGGASGNNFNSDQCIVIGIQPDSFLSNTGNIKMEAHLDYTVTSPALYPAPFTITTKVLNSNTSTFTGDFCVQVFDTLNHLVGTVQTLTGQSITANDSTAALTFATTGLYKMIPATFYYMRLMYRPTSTSTWTPVANNGTFINYTMIDIQNSMYLSNNQSLELTDAMAITPGVTVPAGGLISMNTYISNYGSATFSGNIQAVLINVTTGVSYTVQQYTGQTIHPNTGYHYAFAATSGVPGGTYVLAVQHLYGGTGTAYYTGSDYYENPVVVTVVAGAGVNTLPSLAGNVTVYPNPTKDVVNINMPGVDATGIRITDIEGREVLNITPGTQSSLSVPVTGLASGMYFVNVQTPTEVIVKKIIVAK